MTKATDNGPAVPGYDAATGGYLINDATIEATVGDQDTVTTAATLAAAGFGDGPDGGRELTWDGTVDYPGSSREAHWSPLPREARDVWRC